MVLEVAGRRVRSSLLVIAALAVAAGAASGVRPGTPPRSFTEPVPALDQVPEFTAPPLDLERLLAEDETRPVGAAPYRVGAPVEMSLAPEREGRRDRLGAGDVIWRMRVTSPGAPWLALVLEPFDLPQGVQVHVYDPPGQFVAGPFTAADNNEAGILGLPAVPGPTTVVEVLVPAGTAWLPRVEVARVVVGYRPFGAGGTSDLAGSVTSAAQACEIDVNCGEGQAWKAEKRAVARILFNGWMCTGTLLNDVAGDCKPYFLTAHHCISTAANAAAAVYYWNYERSGCGSGGVSFLTQSGSTLRATRAGSDFTLLELHAPPPAEANVYYAGWSRAATAPSAVVGIHHPAGDVKKISFENHPLVNGIDAGSSYWRVRHWEIGATENGSSGSGIWDPSHHLVGQLWDGQSACPDPTTWDEYGKFSVSWAAGTSAAKRLADWLDPTGAAPVTLDGKDASTCLDPPNCRTCPAIDYGPFTPTDAAQTHASSTVSDGCKLYGFKVTNGCDYRFSFCADGGSAAWDTVLDQLGRNCAAGATSDDACGTQSELNYTADANATVYVKVSGHTPDAWGDYTLAYRELGCTVTCQTCPSYDAELVPTPAYQTDTAAIVPGGCHVYRVNVTKGLRYRFSFCEGDGSASWDTVLERLGPDCDFEASNNNYCGNQSQMTFKAARTGPVYITVRANQSSASGSYTLAYKRF